MRHARETAGLSIDDVARQLKLAPRQVQALEAGDYAQLPGRTFVRGFLRNYARLLGLDGDALLATLPEGASASLDRPTLGPTARVMGELPADTPARAGAARWIVALVFIVVVALAAVYLWRPAVEHARDGGVAGETVVPMLPGAVPPSATPAPSATGTPAPAAAAGTETAPAASAAPAAAAASEAPAAATTATSDAPLVLVFRGTSWAEVKDARGNVLLSTMGYPGATHAVGGTLPLDVVIGNAEAVQVQVRGEAFDLTPYSKQNVAKFQVK